MSSTTPTPTSAPAAVNKAPEAVQSSDIVFLLEMINVLGSTSRERPAFRLEEFDLIACLHERLTNSVELVKAQSAAGADAEPIEPTEGKDTLTVQDLHTLSNLIQICAGRNLFELQHYKQVKAAHDHIKVSLEKFVEEKKSDDSETAAGGDGGVEESKKE
jgi:hypothetical protein